MVAQTLLASWRDTPTRNAIIDFVQDVTSEGSAGFVTPNERLAVFDNDGTLWSEKPIPIQLDFTLFRMAELAQADPMLAGRQPYKAAVERDSHWLGEPMVKHYHGDDEDLRLLMAAVETAFGGMTVDAFSAEVTGWLQSASHPQLHRPYLSCDFVPMIELLRYLDANGFSTYIASGGDRDFMRPFAEQLYGIPSERVIGSAFGLDLQLGEEDSDLLYKSKIEFLDDGPEKPVRIEAGPVGGPWWREATRMATSPCCASPADADAMLFASWSCTMTPSGSLTTWPAPRTHCNERKTARGPS